MHEHLIATNPAFLLVNSQAYDQLVDEVQRLDPDQEPEQVLAKLVFIAEYAAKFHTGRFADGTIENIAFKIGQNLSDQHEEVGNAFTLPNLQIKKQQKRHILHITSGVQSVGGHTRMINHWIRKDPDSCHSIAITEQFDNPVPSWLIQSVEDKGGSFVILPSHASYCQKARWLRQLTKHQVDLVILHHSWCDVIPTVAFADPTCPPVAVLNHADHVFWLGGSIADMTINLRSVSTKLSEERRYIDINYTLPIPLILPDQNLSHQDARQSLGFPDSQQVLVSVGRGEKYRPCGNFDFVAVANKLLTALPAAHLYVIGETEAGITPFLRCPIHERLHFVGSIESPSVYLAAADLYLESFPFGSLTALMEAGLKGLPIVPAIGPLFPLLVANDDSIEKVLKNPQTAEEFINRCKELVANPEARATLGNELRRRLLADHVGGAWLKKLAGLYQLTDTLKHKPMPLPTTECSTAADDVALSYWHVISDGKTYSYQNDNLSSVLSHSAFVFKYIGNYTKARQFALRAVLLEPKRWAYWRLLAIAVLGKLGLSLKQVFHHG